MTTRAGILVALLLFGGIEPVAAQEADHFLVVKPGDPAATPDRAGAFLAAMGRWLEAKLPASEHVEGRIANRADQAAAAIARDSPILAFVPAGFYLGAIAPGLTPARVVAQIPRFGVDVERYYLVTAKGGPPTPAALRGTTVRTTADFDAAYLRRVVFADGLVPGEDFRLEASENLADELFYLLEGDPAGPDALLLDEELKHFFEADDFVWPELQVIWRSAPLPRDLVVAFGEWSEGELAALRDALVAMDETPEGRELLDLMDSEGFEAVDRELLERAATLYRSSGGGVTTHR
ncbi:MAG: PhnD/SsuA/transferrin family substrate-binding protein [Longimicrobiales bacterium]|nr:PhnD/SsuA/transferrin family substrate-binding protein [Longimicrobiales bacterium]